MLLSLLLSSALAQEPDHEVHEALRALFRDAQTAVNEGRIDDLGPLVTDDFEATSLTQEVISGRDGVQRYFGEWFGPDRYLKSMRYELEADALTDLSPDRSWGLVRGGGREHYVANEGVDFDFTTRWTAVVERGDDGKWRIRAIHFGTNQLDNPVLTRVKGTLVRYGVVGAVLALVVGLLAGAVGGFLAGRRRAG